MKQLLLCASFLLFLVSACGQIPNPPSTPTVTILAMQKPMDTPMPSTLTPEPTAVPMPPLTLRRGVNMGNMLEAPNEGDWGLRVHEEYFDLLKTAGFDFVRLPVRWNAHAQTSAPYRVDPAFFSRIDEIVHWGVERGLSIIIDFHNYEEMMSDPRGNKERFLAIWKQVADHYKDAPASVLFELLNEPNTALDASLWNEYAADALKVVRPTNPDRDVVIGPMLWNSFLMISTLDLPDDPHVIATFHYYEPFHFTHQGAEWVDGSDPWLGTTWDATSAEASEVVDNFDFVADWARQHHHLRVLLGEFGAYSKADMDSRVRWTEFIRSEAERHGFAWAYWEFGSGFGAYDPSTRLWRRDLLNALIPSQAAE